MTEKRGRKSSGDLTVVRGMAARVKAPEHLTVGQSLEWHSIVDSLPSDWFRPADIPLLAAYCAASALYKEALLMIQIEGIVIGEKPVRQEDGTLKEMGSRKSHPAANILVTQANSMATMAMKLRLCPSARYSEKTANTKASASGGNRPWETAA